MQIHFLEISGLRSIERASLSFDEVTALIGGNNAGKSTLLHALRLFFEAAPKITQDDFHKREYKTIKITVTFDNLTESERNEFSSAIHDEKLTISRTLSADSSSHQTYSVLARVYPAFAAVRDETNRTQKRVKFNALADSMKDLDKVTNADQAVEKMKEWEEAHPDDLAFAYVREFFGAPNVANGKLKKKTSLHFIPAVANVSEETSDARHSPIINLLADIAKQTYENRKEVKEFIEQTQVDFGNLVDPGKVPQLAKISESLTETIRRYYGETRLLADWQVDEGVTFSFPQPVIKVEDGGFLSGLEHVGHGLQRAALFSIIEFLARSSVEAGEEKFRSAQSDIILLIEEPEIYQHPPKQKLVSNAFRKICEEFSSETGIRFQVIFTTHSEKFVDIGNFNSTRIIRRDEDKGVSRHNIASLSISKCSEYFARLVDKPPMSDEAFQAKLHIFSRELCEGFFARKLILVEGVTDKAVLEGVYRSFNRDNIAEGIMIVSVDGKTKMDKPFFIFSALGIPTYAVFDSDIDNGERKVPVNKLLQSIAGIAEPEDFPSGAFERFAAFERSLEGYTREVCGEDWQATFRTVADELGLDISDICKTPLAVAKVVEILRNEGTVFPLFKEVVNKVDALTIQQFSQE